MAMDGLSKNVDAKISTYSQEPKNISEEPKIQMDNNKSESNMDTTDGKKTGKSEEKFENVVNETLENTRNDSKDDENKADTSVEDGSSKGEDISSVKNDEEGNREEKEEDKNGTMENDSPDKNGPPNQTIEEEEKKLMIIKIATIVGVATLGAIIAPFAVVGALGAVGFGTAGVAAGSIAAAIQSSVYGGAVASGSIFAVCQSVGAAGLGIAGTTATAVGGGGIFAGIGAALSNLFSKNNTSTSDNDAKPSSIDNTSDVEAKVVTADPDCRNQGNSCNDTKCNKKTQTAAANEISENEIDSCDTTETDDTPPLEIEQSEEKKPLLDTQKIIGNPENINSKAE